MVAALVKHQRRLELGERKAKRLKRGGTGVVRLLRVNVGRAGRHLHRIALRGEKYGCSRCERSDLFNDTLEKNRGP